MYLLLSFSSLFIYTTLFYLLYGEGSLLAKLDTPGASITDIAFSCPMGCGIKKNGVKLAGIHTLTAAVAFCPIQRDDAGFLLQLEGVLGTNFDTRRLWALQADNRNTGQRMGEGDTDVGFTGIELSCVNHGANNFARFAAGTFLSVYRQSHKGFPLSRDT